MPDKESPMPNYEFECQECKKNFVLTETFAQHGKHREKCPACGSTKIRQLFAEVNVKTSRKS